MCEFEFHLESIVYRGVTTDKVASVGESASVPAIIGLLVDMLTYSLEIDLGTVSISS